MLMRIGKIIEVINSKEILVEEDSDKAKRFVCEVPSFSEEDITNDNFMVRNINLNLRVSFFVPENRYDGKGFIVNFYKEKLDVIINKDVNENSIITRIMSKNLFKLFFDGSFYISSFSKIFGIFYDATKKSLNISSKIFKLSTSTMNLNSEDDSTTLTVGDKIFNISVNSSNGELKIKDSSGSEFKINNKNISIKTLPNKNIEVNNLIITNNKISYKKNNNNFEITNNYVKIINGSSKLFLGKTGVELSCSGSGIFVDKKGDVQLQTKNSGKVNILGDLNVKSKKIKISSTAETSITTTKLKITDQSGSMSPLALRKIVKKLKNVINNIKPISPSGICSPDLTTIPKLEMLELDMRREVTNLNITEQKTK